MGLHTRKRGDLGVVIRRFGEKEVSGGGGGWRGTKVRNVRQSVRSSSKRGGAEATDGSNAETSPGKRKSPLGVRFAHRPLKSEATTGPALGPPAVVASGLGLPLSAGSYGVRPRPFELPPDLHELEEA